LKTTVSFAFGFAEAKNQITRSLEKELGAENEVTCTSHVWDDWVEDRRGSRIHARILAAE
jgi:hypothetical protein